MGAVRGLNKKKLIEMGQEFIEKNPGVRFTGSKLHEATGISPSIINFHFGSIKKYREALGLEEVDYRVGTVSPDVVLERAEVQALKTENRRLGKRAAVEDRFIRNLQRAYPMLPKLPKVPKVARSKPSDAGSEDALLLLSDMHFGEVVSEPETGGLGHYDVDTFVYRLEYMAEKIHKLVQAHQPHITKLNIAALGDSISGMIHEELAETNDGNSVDMMLGCAHLLAQFMLDMLQTFDEIESWWITGNHGRTGKRYRFKERYLNWDYVLAQHVRALLRTEKRIKFNIPRSFWTIMHIRNQRLLIIHGDQIRGSGGMPFYGMQRALGELTVLLRSRGGFDAIILGHFHNVGMVDRSDVELIVNGSMKGPDEFSIGALFQGSKPKQLFMGVHPKIGLSFRYPIVLAGAPRSGPHRYLWDREYPEASLEKIDKRLG
ncbi:MAG: hypothetical protein V3S55_07795 [Nitrospiraceae bacterium]